MTMCGGEAYIKAQAKLFSGYLNGKVKFCSFVKAGNALFRHRKNDPGATFPALWTTVCKVVDSH
jgi:hypothetical protein